MLCEFRARLTEGDAANRLLQVMLNRLVEAGLLKAGGRQRTDATHVLAAVRRLSRLELAGESLRAALEQLAQAAPDWLLPLVEPEWDKRYGRKVEIGKVPWWKAGVTALAEAFGRDGCKVRPPPGRPTPRPACASCRRWRSCAGCGCTTTTGMHADAARLARRPRSASGVATVRLPVRHRRALLRQAGHRMVRLPHPFHGNVHVRPAGGGGARGHDDCPGPGR
ncbi:hypothetical protein E4K10_05290 [Streptomyces sp. T1317-0309]|nr:hypothetical protein E4K10_05290 [Streptomyces sp. T1317-0309]